MKSDIKRYLWDTSNASIQYSSYFVRAKLGLVAPPSLWVSISIKWLKY